MDQGPKKDDVLVETGEGDKRYSRYSHVGTYKPAPEEIEKQENHNGNRLINAITKKALENKIKDFTLGFKEKFPEDTEGNRQALREEIEKIRKEFETISDKEYKGELVEKEPRNLEQKTIKESGEYNIQESKNAA
ncbi:MAG: hypothetical protein V4665_02480 [Patescibacteria group bacterium]